MIGELGEVRVVFMDRLIRSIVVFYMIDVYSKWGKGDFVFNVNFV